MNLMPMFIDSSLAAGDIDTTIKYGVLSCIECGCCAFICPAARPLVQTMKLAKKKIKEREYYETIYKI
jgi:electron transport complex protein RnfC